MPCDVGLQPCIAGGIMCEVKFGNYCKMCKLLEKFAHFTFIG